MPKVYSRYNALEQVLLASSLDIVRFAMTPCIEIISFLYQGFEDRRLVIAPHDKTSMHDTVEMKCTKTSHLRLGDSV